MDGLSEISIDTKIWEVKYHTSADRKIPPCLVLTHKDSLEGLTIEIHFENYEKQGLKYRISAFCRNMLDNKGVSTLQSSFSGKLNGFEWAENEAKSYYRYERFFDKEIDCITNLDMLTNNHSVVPMIQ